MEISGGGGKGVKGCEGFGFDGCDEAALGRGGDEVVEGGLELLRDCDAGLHDFRL